MAKYERIQIDSFSTWHSNAGVEVNQKNGDIFVVHDGGLFKYHRENKNYAKLPVIAPLKTGLGAACISIDENTGDVAVIHQNGLNLYQPSGSGYKEVILDIFQGITARARCIFYKTSGDIYVVSDSVGLYVHRKTRTGYEKMVIDSFGAWHSSSGIGIDQKTGDIFVVTNHVGGGQGPYPVKSPTPEPDKWPKGDCLVRYRPIGDQRYVKMIVDWPVITLGGTDIDVNTATGEVVMIADPCLYIYKPEGDKYARSTIGAAYSRGEGAALKVKEGTREIVAVADSYIRIFTPQNHGEPIDAAMTRSCGVDVTINAGTGEIIMVDNRGLTIYPGFPVSVRN